MKSALGITVGLFLLLMAFGAFRVASGGWSAGQSDIGFWWTVIAGNEYSNVAVPIVDHGSETVLLD